MEGEQGKRKEKRGKTRQKVYKQRFKDLSLKKKLLVFYSVLFVLPLFMISIIIYAEVSGSMLEKIRYSAMQSYEQAESYLEYKILQMIQRTDVVVTSPTLKAEIRKSSTAITDQHQQLASREAIRSYLQSVESSTRSIRIHIYIAGGDDLLADGDYIHPLSEADNALWYQKKGNRKVYFAPGIYLEEGKQERYVALVRDIAEESNYRLRNCVLRMDIGIEELEKILQNATPTENAVSYLVNKEDLIVAASSQEKLEAIGLSEELTEEFKYSRYAQQSEPAETELNQKTVYCMRNKIRNTDWEMVTVIPKADMVSGIARLQYMVAGLMLLFGMLTIAGGAFIISWIVRRLSRMNDIFNQVKSGDMEAHLENDTKDEIGMLYDNYNEMITRTSELMDEKYRMGIHLKSAELKALQSQINPHFLYNTLEMLNWLAYAGRTEDIHTAVISLSKYYRLILNKGKDSLTLGEELQHVGYYIKIQDIRFPGKISYTEEVEEDLKDSLVPKIILQPLVENAILHGIWEKKSKQGNIRILGYEEEEGTVCIKVMDDGAGMDAQTLARVMDNSLSGSGYGMKNVHARLQLIFGEAYGLECESRVGEGTCVTVRFPRGRRLPKQ
ncbi:two-component system sensor histidine kinase YesM [Anaerotaenia torta]|uniref:cache domain-containing sensor histidine kinase n=1 Tax=Anaerotaenia torta TaxID=433293 RepID=UPI003D2592AC